MRGEVPGLLVRHLGRGGEGALATLRHQGAAIAQREDRRVARGLQRGAHDEAVGPVHLQPVHPPQHRGRADAGGPDPQRGVDPPSALQRQAAGIDRGDRVAGQHLHPDLAQHPGRGGGNALRQGGQDARRGLDQRDVDAPPQPRQAIAGGEVERVVDLPGQLRAGGAGPDDGDGKRLVRTVGERPDDLLAHRDGEGFRLVAAVDEAAMLLGAGRAEVVGMAADREDERVIGQAGGDGVLPVRPLQRAQRQPPPRPVQPAQQARPVGEAVPPRMGEVGDLFLRRVERAGRDLVQPGFPDIAAAAVHQGDGIGDGPAPAVRQTDGQVQPRRAAAHHHDAVRLPCRALRAAPTDCHAFLLGPPGHRPQGPGHGGPAMGATDLAARPRRRQLAADI